MLFIWASHKVAFRSTHGSNLLASRDSEGSSHPTMRHFAIRDGGRVPPRLAPSFADGMFRPFVVRYCSYLRRSLEITPPFYRLFTVQDKPKDWNSPIDRKDVNRCSLISGGNMGRRPTQRVTSCTIFVSATLPVQNRRL
jgi:hypothetical protein